VHAAIPDLSGGQDVRVDDVKVEVFRHHGVQQSLVLVQLVARWESTVGIHQQEVRVDPGALEALGNPRYPLRQGAILRPVGHLEKEGRRRIVLGQPVGRVEEPVRHQVAGAHQQKPLGDNPGILQRARPAQAVETLTECTFLAVKVGRRSGGAGVLPQLGTQEIHYRTGLGVAGIPAGDVHVSQLSKTTGRLLAGVGNAVGVAPSGHRLLERIAEHAVRQAVQIAGHLHVLRMRRVLQCRQ